MNKFLNFNRNIYFVYFIVILNYNKVKRGIFRKIDILWL